MEQVACGLCTSLHVWPLGFAIDRIDNRRGVDQLNTVGLLSFLDACQMLVFCSSYWIFGPLTTLVHMVSKEAPASVPAVKIPQRGCETKSSSIPASIGSLSQLKDRKGLRF